MTFSVGRLAIPTLARQTSRAELRQRHVLVGSSRATNFLAICRWKTPRSQPRCSQNRSDFIEAVTRVALEAEDEELKIRSLLLGGRAVSPRARFPSSRRPPAAPGRG